jgi:hypothetical protein
MKYPEYNESRKGLERWCLPIPIEWLFLFDKREIMELRGPQKNTVFFEKENKLYYIKNWSDYTLHICLLPDNKNNNINMNNIKMLWFDDKPKFDLESGGNYYSLGLYEDMFCVILKRFDLTPKLYLYFGYDLETIFSNLSNASYLRNRYIEQTHPTLEFKSARVRK